jgi:hypothetical protein
MSAQGGKAFFFKKKKRRVGKRPYFILIVEGSPAIGLSKK